MEPIYNSLSILQGDYLTSMADFIYFWLNYMIAVYVFLLFEIANLPVKLANLAGCAIKS